MNARHLILALVGALAVGPAFACGGAQVSPSPSQPGATRAPVDPNAQTDIKLFADALGDVPLTAQQRGEVDTLAVDADGRHAAIAAARKSLELAVADQVDAGRIDRAALSPRIDAIVEAAQRTQIPDRAAFERLHAILDPDQRVAFVNAVEAHGRERMGAGGPMRIAEWADVLKLSDDQRAKIKALLMQHAGEAHGDAHEHPMSRGAKILGAFRQDKFVFDEVVPAQDLRQRVTDGADRFLGLAAQVLPLLTPEQRAAAAQRLRQPGSSVAIGP